MNAQIQKARDAAMDLLKPSQADLEHGLELHDDAIVCDVYGLGVKSAADPAEINSLIEDHADNLTLRDRREQQRVVRAALNRKINEEWIEAWKATGITCIVQNAGQETQDPLRLLRRLAYHTFQTDRLGHQVQKVTSPDQIEQVKKQGRQCMYFSANGVPLHQRWESLQEELDLIQIYYQLGIRMMHLTYNRRNMIGQGCGEPGDVGLSDFGQAVVREMNRVGVIVDVAHSAWQTCIDAASNSSRPIVISHSGAHALCPSIRCKSDEAIAAVVETGGLMGICGIARFLGGTGDINAMLDHIDYVTKRFGVDHVGIGSDRSYISMYEADNHIPLPHARTRWDTFWPVGHRANDGPQYSEQAVLSTALTNYPMITVGLVQRGYSDEDIRKILGGNFLRVAKAVIADTAFYPTCE